MTAFVAAGIADPGSLRSAHFPEAGIRDPGCGSRKFGSNAAGLPSNFIVTPTPAARPRLDPRWYQIAALSGLFFYGRVWLGFDVPLGQATLIFAAALGAQWLGTQWSGLPAFESKSALISAFSLCLLLRTNSPALAVAGAVLAVGSKFVLRWRGKHLFNPTNFGLVALLVVADGRVWVSPGQWGSVAFFGFLMVCVGGLVVTRAARADVALAFLGCWLALLFGRSAWLGEPLSIPWHRMESGALLLFTFFMISDPKTTPDSRAGRLVFAALVACGAAFVQFKLFRTNGLLWSLAASAFFVPALDFLLPGSRYRWSSAPHPRIPVSNPKKTPAHRLPNYEPVTS